MRFMEIGFSATRSGRSGLDLGIFYGLGGSRSRGSGLDLGVFDGFNGSWSRRWGFNGFNGFDGFNGLSSAKGGNDRCGMEKGLITSDRG